MSASLGDVVADRLRRLAPIAAAVLLRVGGVFALRFPGANSAASVGIGILQAALLLGVARLLARAWWRRYAHWVGVLFAGLVHGLIGVQAFLQSAPDLAALFGLALPLAASAAIPWGARLQVVLAAAALGSFLVPAWGGGQGVLRALASTHGIVLVAALTASVRVAAELEWMQREAIAGQRASEEAANVYRDLVENAAEAIYRTDMNGRFVFANPAATALFAMDEGELGQRSLWECIAPGARDEVRAFYAAQYRERRPRGFGDPGTPALRCDGCRCANAGHGRGGAHPHGAGAGKAGPCVCSWASALGHCGVDRPCLGGGPRALPGCGRRCVFDKPFGAVVLRQTLAAKLAAGLPHRHDTVQFWPEAGLENHSRSSG